MTTPTTSAWTLLPDFDHLTAFGAQCVNCGSPKHKDHEFIFRPNRMDEVDGFWDLCQDCIEGACFVLGFVRPKVYQAQLREIKALQRKEEELKDKLAASRDALATVTRENVRLQDALEEAQSPREVLSA